MDLKIILVELTPSNEDGNRKFDSGIGSVHMHSRGELDMNRKIDPQISVLDKFQNFLNQTCQEDHVCPIVLDGKEACIKFHSKG